MSKNFLKINDLVKFSLIDPNLIKVKDDYEGAFKPDQGSQTHPTGLGTVAEDNPASVTQSGLQVKIAATHSGIITRNNGFYLPDKMNAGASSFTDNFPKPILLHHEEQKDPIGRVAESRYIDTSEIVQDTYDGLVVKNRAGKEVGTITSTLIKDFVGKKMPLGMQVDIVCSLLRDSLLNDAAYSGLGHIQIVANITDKVAIQKLLDGRYLTGSIGATTDAAICSVCRQDWTEAGQCEHKPGGIYDSVKCFIIAGRLLYDEYSFVNMPADRHSGVLALNYNGVQDNIEIAKDYLGRIHEVQLTFPQFDSVEKEREMAQKDKDTQVKPKGTEKVINDSVTPKSPEDVPAEKDKKTETPVKDTLPAGEKGDKSVVVEGVPVTPSGGTPVQDNATPKDSNIKDESTEETVETFLVRVVDTKLLKDEDEEKFYDLLWDEAVAGFEDGEFTLEQLGVEKLEDVKLSTEKRKKLASSTFCGPGKSFPVPDCAHVTAARRLIDRYKGEGNKDTILASVSRKAKALGCDTNKKKKDSTKTPEDTSDTNKDAMHHARMMHVILAAIEENHWVPSDQEPALNDDEKGMLSTILKRLASQVGKDAITQAVIAEELALDPACATALEDEVVKSETTVGDLRDELAALRKEYNLLFKDMETLQDSLVEEKTQTRKVKESHLSTLKVLRDRKDSKPDWTSLEDSAIDSELERLTGEVDMTKITDKLGDGTSRIPTEEVDNPSGVQDNEDPKVSVKDLKAIEYEVHRLLYSGPGGKDRAENFIKRMQGEGRLPKKS